ncbi:MAG TPA: hypothetical protein VF158_15515 [Longimicrobiales bacterium]
MRRIVLVWLLGWCAAFHATPELAAQIRPLEPLSPGVGRCERCVEVAVGVAAYGGQRASLVGAEGRLVELGYVHLVWRLDRVAFEAAGTAWRLFDARRRFADPVGVVADAGARRRADVGDFRVATIVTMVESGGASVVLRFGTRLPTTDDGVGLERDRTDFFALVGGRLVRGRLAVTAESGLGIQGTREAAYDQVDVWLYSAAVEYQWGVLTPELALVGQADGLSGPAIRGNENLGELRAGLRVGRRRWVRATVVRGLAPFSPRVGVEATVGVVF